MRDVGRHGVDSSAGSNERGADHILFLAASPTIDGPLPKLAPHMVAGLREAGFAVDVSYWSRRHEDESLWEKALGRAQDLIAVVRRLRRRPVDVLFVTTAHNWGALLRDVPLMLTVRSLCSVIVLQFHGSEPEDLMGHGHRLFRMLTRLVVGRADAVLVLSSEELTQWRRFAPETTFRLVTNPFVSPERPVSRPRRSAGEPVRVLFVGRLEHAKGVDDLIDVVGELAPAFPLRLELAGRADEALQLQRRISAAGLDGVVESLGYVEGPALWRLYQEADVFVLPSRREGFPLVLLEAMAFGLPIVTTGIRGAADHLIDGRNALLVAPGDRRALASALARLLQDADLRREMGAANRAAVARFSPEWVVPRYAAIIREVLDRTRAV